MTRPARKSNRNANLRRRVRQILRWLRVRPEEVDTAISQMDEIGRAGR